MEDLDSSKSFSLQRSKSLPHVVAQKHKNDNVYVIEGNMDSGVSMKSDLCASLLEAANEMVKMQQSGKAAGSEVQGDFASGGSGMLASEPQSSAHSDAAAVKQMVLNQIDKKLKDLRTLKQHYYPEGGWGWVILVVAFSVHALVTGSQLAVAMFVNGASEEIGGRLQDLRNLNAVSVFSVNRSRKLLAEAGLDTSWLGALSMSISLLISPLTIALCRRKSTRLTAVMGGLITALGCLFTSFASQFHQLFLSYGILAGIGVSFTRDPATLMIGQYFKRKREFVEIILVSGSGIGLAVMSVFIQLCIGTYGWRLGLQAITGTVFLTFFLGTFYRSASLYHPQRRAILHLKSQKRKIKNKDKEKNKAQDDRPPYFDFTTLKSRTVQILLSSIFVSSFGLCTPIFYLVQQAYVEGIHGRSLLLLQVYLGAAWTLGCWVFGFLVIINSKECRISKQYLCQVSLFLCGVSILTFTAVNGYNGYVLFVWVYGVFLGGHSYVLKMFIYEKVRARNFARAWGFAQSAMAIPIFIGIPVAGYLNHSSVKRSGYYFSAICVILGSLVLSLIDVHRKNLRKKHKKHQRAMSKKSVGNGSVTTHHTTCNSIQGDAQGSSNVGPEIELSSHNSSHNRRGSGGPQSENAGDIDRKLSFSDQDDIMPPIALLNHPHSFTYNDLIDLQNKPELTNFSEEGIADMDLPDHLLLEDLEFLDNITSCNKVENCLMLSEYEQNLIKETENPPVGAATYRRGRKWSLFRQQSTLMSDNSPEHHVIQRGPTLGVGGLRQNSFSAAIDHGLPVSSLSSHNGQNQKKRFGPGNRRELPIFPNTAAWSSRLQMPNTNGQKRSITVIEEASV